MQITVMAKKGGVGKSTVSLMLNEAFLQAGRSARVHDWDAQGTSSKALALINGKKTATGPEADIIIFDTLPSLDHTATKTAFATPISSLLLPQLPPPIFGRLKKLFNSPKPTTTLKPKSALSSTKFAGRLYWGVLQTKAASRRPLLLCP